METFLSAAETVVIFDPPLPLLRSPILATACTDEDSLVVGPSFVLAFRDAASFVSAFRSTQAKLFKNCLDGARVGCSIRASNKCKPPWWKIMFGASKADFTEREQCEEQEMAACLASSKEECVHFVKEKCIRPFQDARIATLSAKQIPELALWSSSRSELAGMNLEVLLRSCQIDREATNYRGSILLQTMSLENFDSRTSASS